MEDQVVLVVGLGQMVVLVEQVIHLLLVPLKEIMVVIVTDPVVEEVVELEQLVAVLLLLRVEQVHQIQ